jgi:hypothetical protein
VEFSTDSVAPDAATTSLQLHLRVPPDRFAAYYNAAQTIAGAQVAVGANAPYLLGCQAWQETRITLLEQLLDTRRPKEVRAGAPARVRLGDRWINDPVELFDDVVRDFAPLVPTLESEGPDAALAAGHTPGLRELRLHNGTVWRWNRPVYDIANGLPHVRLENRVLPAGPTAVDMVANALFFYGLLRVMVEAERPLWSYMSFDAAHENFVSAARNGMDATLYWPGTGWIQPDELVLRKLLPMARQGLQSWGAPDAEAERFLEIIEGRCLAGVNGSEWFARRMHARSDLDRYDALRRTLEEYREQMHSNRPVHTWE